MNKLLKEKLDRTNNMIPGNRYKKLNIELIVPSETTKHDVIIALYGYLKENKKPRFYKSTFLIFNNRYLDETRTVDIEITQQNFGRKGGKQ